MDVKQELKYFLSPTAVQNRDIMNMSLKNQVRALNDNEKQRLYNESNPIAYSETNISNIPRTGGAHNITETRNVKSDITEKIDWNKKVYGEKGDVNVTNANSALVATEAVGAVIGSFATVGEGIGQMFITAAQIPKSFLMTFNIFLLLCMFTLVQNNKMLPLAQKVADVVIEFLKIFV